MKNIVFAGYTGGENRGCEAIARSTSDLFLKYPLNRFMVFRHKEERSKNIKNGYFDQCLMYHEYSNRFINLANAAYNKLFGNVHLYQGISQREIFNAAKEGAVLHIGGDTYCYGRSLVNLSLLYHCKKRKIPVFLWGASISDDVVEDKKTLKALNSYDALYIREQLSYDLLIKAGISPEKLVKMSDPAFVLRCEEVQLDDSWWNKKVLGINLSPLASECCENAEAIEKGIKLIIDYILEYTDWNIALIPHVYEKSMKFMDYEPLLKLKNNYTEDRVRVVCGDYNCSQLKYIISKCSFLIAARTHASIAAYSTYVPTLVLGYSVKSKGIATDIFGDYRNYVLPVQEISNDKEIFEFFLNAFERQDSIKKVLEKVIPEYKKQAEEAARNLAERLEVKK